jgi:hypothetical protein
VLVGRIENATGCRISQIGRREIPSGCNSGEQVTLRLQDGRELCVFLKYGPIVGGSIAYGHRGGVAYESETYRHILRPLNNGTPRLWASGRDEAANQAWLIIEFLDQCDDLATASASDPSAIVRAASWIGSFHRRAENSLGD